MDYFVNCLLKKIKGEISLPSSKSISNRLLVIQALAGQSFKIYNLSRCDDTDVMAEAFQNSAVEINIGHAGTAMRFLTAFFAATGKQKIITGSDRMKNRPIAELIDGLNSLGADIHYLEKKGFPPVQTSGKPLIGNSINIKGNISSQFITSLMLIAPYLKEGLTINIDANLISASYVELTLQIMKSFGINIIRQDNIIKINRQQYSGYPYTVESDWSAASYWYQIAALADEADIFLKGLQSNSLQGDSNAVKLFETIGIKSTFTDNGVAISKEHIDIPFFEFDFVNNPDLVQTFVVTLCLLNIPFKVSGAGSLRIKETDRIEALQNEMKKLGFVIKESSDGVLEWNNWFTEPQKNISIDTWKDHRMALAFAPAALKLKNLSINDAMVVTKSYPDYWDHLESVGFEISPKISC